MTILLILQIDIFLQHICDTRFFFLGSFAEIVLSGGETSTIIFRNTIRPKQHFCMVLMYRSGPTIDGSKVSNKVAVTFEMPNARPVIMNLPSVSSKQFFQYSIDLNWTYDTKVIFLFYIHYFELRDIYYLSKRIEIDSRNSSRKIKSNGCFNYSSYMDFYYQSAI